MQAQEEQRNGEGTDDEEHGTSTEFGGQVIGTCHLHGGNGGGRLPEEEPGAAESGDGRANGQEVAAENREIGGPDEIRRECPSVLATEVIEDQATDGKGVGAEREAAQEAAVQLAGEPQHHETLERPAQGDPFFRNCQGGREDNEERREGNEGHEQTAVLAVRGEEPIDKHDVEGRESQSEHGDRAGGIGGGDHTMAEREKGGAVGHRAENFQEGGFFAADEVVEEHRGSEEQEEAGEEQHHDDEVGGHVVLEGQSHKGVGEEHGEIVEEWPVAAARDAQDADTEQE